MEFTDTPGLETTYVIQTPPTDAFSAGDGLLYFTVPESENGKKLMSAHAAMNVAGSSAANIQIHNVTQAGDALNTPITIDNGEFSSYTAVTPPQSSSTNMTTGDLLRVDIDSDAGGVSGGLQIIFVFGNA